MMFCCLFIYLMLFAPYFFSDNRRTWIIAKGILKSKTCIVVPILLLLMLLLLLIFPICLNVLCSCFSLLQPVLQINSSWRSYTTLRGITSTHLHLSMWPGATKLDKITNFKSWVFTRLKNSHFPNFKVICQFCLSTFNIYLKNSLFPIDFWQVCWIIILKTALLTCVRVGYIFVFAVVVVCESNLWPNPTKSPLSVTFFFQMFWCWKCKIWCSKMIHYMSFVVESHIFPFHLNTFNSEKKIFWKFLYFLLILDHILKSALMTCSFCGSGLHIFVCFVVADR